MSGGPPPVPSGPDELAHRTGGTFTPGDIRNMGRSSPGCLAIVVLAVVLALFGVVAGTSSSSSSTPRAVSAPAQGSPSAAPIIQPPASTAPSPTTQPPVAPTTAVPAPTTSAPAPTPTTAAPTPVVTPPPSPTTQPPAPPTTSPPAPPPTQACGYPSSISVTGASTSQLSGSGGQFTVVGGSVVLSTPALVDCGQGHYQLAFHAVSADGNSFHNGYDCQKTGFNYDISSYVNPGDNVTVTLNLPPNACGA